MTDRELIEHAAFAAMISGEWTDEFGGCLKIPVYNTVSKFRFWNPLTNSDDALQLVVDLDMQVEYLAFTGNARARPRKICDPNIDWVTQYCCNLEDLSLERCDPYAATRRAIVRAAAEVGKLRKQREYPTTNELLDRSFKDKE